MKAYWNLLYASAAIAFSVYIFIWREITKDIIILCDKIIFTNLKILNKNTIYNKFYRTTKNQLP
jgi:hypothetical protein